MTDVRAIEPGKYNKFLADALKKIEEFKAPEWASFIKSGPNKVRPINEVDFWQKRAASVLRQIYIKGAVGVGRLRSRYGSRKKRGVRPARFQKASGKIIRVILQQAESAGLLEKVKGKHAGRNLTQKGRELLESVGGSQ